jgi:hypothetical protein
MAWETSMKFRIEELYLCLPMPSNFGCNRRMMTDTEGCRILGYKNPVVTSKETHYVSATEPSRLMLCKIWIFTAVTMKNAVFWDIKNPVRPHSKRYFSATENSRLMLLRFDDFAAVTMKNTVLWNVMPCRSCKNRRFGGKYRLHHQGEENQS